MKKRQEGPGPVLCLLAVLYALGGAGPARAQEDGACRVVREGEGPARLEPEGERTHQVCSGPWCTGLIGQYQGGGRTVSCLYVTDKAGTPTGALAVGTEMDAPQTVRFLSSRRIEVSFSTRERSWSEVYELDEQGRFVKPKPRPAPSSAARPPAPRESSPREAEGDPLDDSFRQSACIVDPDELHCPETPLPAEPRARLARACGRAPEAMTGVCSKAGCLGVVRTSPPGEEVPHYCLAWARPGQPAHVVPSADRPLQATFLDGSQLCLNYKMSCSAWSNDALTTCVEVSGPVPRWVHEPPGRVSGRAGYEVLPYRGEPPLIDGKAQELEWKAPTLFIQTAALVQTGLKAWKGPEDASAEWILRSRGEELLFLVRVRDDHVLAGESLEQNDAVGLTARRVGEGGEHPARFVLAPGGQVRASGVEHARCAWSEATGGYRMECALPVAELGLRRPPAVWSLRVGVEDRDGPGRALKLLGSSNRFIAWSEFPPSWDESLKLFAWDPCQPDEEEAAAP